MRAFSGSQTVTTFEITVDADFGRVDYSLMVVCGTDGQLKLMSVQAPIVARRFFKLVKIGGMTSA